MKKSLILILLLAILTFQCSDPLEENNAYLNYSQKLVPREEIDQLIIHSLEQTGRFNWTDVSDEVLWSALMHSDSTLTIGYQPQNEKQVSSRLHQINVRDYDWVQARNEIAQQVDKLERRKSSTARSPLSFFSHEVLPYIEMKVTNLEVIATLRLSAFVRYVEPLSYQVDFSRYEKANSQNRKASDSGCSNDPENNINTTDYSTISPNAKMAWNYNYMHISEAWSYGTGSGITVGLIDTGVSPDQPKLNSEFNSGESSGRFIQKYGTYVSSWWPWADPDGPNDKCGHGTAMAGTIAAPRSNSGSSVGVAYNCNLVVYRGTGDVIVNGGSEKTGVSNALVALGNRTDVKVISMSIGDIFSSSKVSDGIRYAYGKGKLIFCAAGTSTSFTNWVGVIFPAWMNETVAVTGIKEGSGYQRCDVCHSGSEVDFTIVMERSSSGNHPLSLAMYGSQPSTVGGSSVATATAAGIASLVWSAHPGWTRDQVLNKMKQSSSIYPGRHGDYGWGTPNALLAVQ